jgi:hypothetical protein
MLKLGARRVSFGPPRAVGGPVCLAIRPDWPLDPCRIVQPDDLMARS